MPKSTKTSATKAAKATTRKAPRAKREAPASAPDATDASLPSERLGVPPTTPDVDVKLAAAEAAPNVSTAATDALDAPTAAQDATADTPEPKPETTAAAPKTRKIGGLDAALQVLRDAGEPLSCKTMVERMLAQGLWQTNGKTPAATIYAAILREISTKGDASRFRKTGRGQFTLAG